MQEYHSFIWPSTKNFTSSTCWWLEKYQSKEERNEIFNRTTAFAVEKLDGTNIGKDEKGELFSRRLVISAESDMFLKTSLKLVKAADIRLVKKKLCEKIFLRETLIENLIVYGELIVNEKYDYKQRKLRGSWLIFGAMVIVKPQDLEIISNKLKERNFNFAVEEGNIRIFASSTFFNLIKECNLVTPKVKGEDLSLFDIVLKNKEEMETGKLEGLVITFKNDLNTQHQIYKWKGAQEEQPKAEKDIAKALETINDEKKGVDDKTKILFSVLHSVLHAKNEKNPLVKKVKSKDIKSITQTSKNDKYDIIKNLDKNVKKVITNGIFSSLTKYDDVNVFLDTENKEKAEQNYKDIIKEEVKQHFVEEKARKPNTDEEIFIKSTVESIINRKIKKKIGK